MKYYAVGELIQTKNPIFKFFFESKTKPISRNDLIQAYTKHSTKSSTMVVFQNEQQAIKYVKNNTENDITTNLVENDYWIRPIYEVEVGRELSFKKGDSCDTSKYDVAEISPGDAKLLSGRLVNIDINKAPSNQSFIDLTTSDNDEIIYNKSESTENSADCCIQ